MKPEKENLFTMTWKGSKTPQGAKIGGIPIGHMRDGVIVGSAGELGTYVRSQEFGGADGNEHTILISTHHTDVTPPPGGKITFSEINTTGMGRGNPPS